MIGKPRLAIVGNGMATSRLLDELVQRRGHERFDVVVFGEEPGGAYNRILLSKALADGRSEEIVLKDACWYEQHGIELRSGERIVGAKGRTLLTEAGAVEPFDKLVLALGSVPIVPPLPGIRREDGSLKPGAYVFRTVDDCLSIRAAARRGTKAVVIGGGLLGLEAAKGLCDLGADTTVVHLMPTLMERQLDATGGEFLATKLTSLGMSIRTSTSSKAVLGEERVEGLLLSDDSRIACDLLVVACGVRPRIDLAQAIGVPTERGILVDDRMRVPGLADIFAVGECCQHRGSCYGIVAPIWEQAKVLADELCATDDRAAFAGYRLYTKLKVADVEVASLGAIEAETAEDEVVQIREPHRGVYRKLIVRDGRLVGAQFVGDTQAAAAALRYFDRGDQLPENRLELFCDGAVGATSEPVDVEICNCRNVGKKRLEEAIVGGCDSVESLSCATGAGTGCGSCRGELARLLAQRRRPVPKPEAPIAAAP
ncbi:MAG TPA: FAD-dependent oxidoreductase [Pirellulaceae bacterium]|jgi:nitrite reductase (NADH) large subunit|nr:FAD-dependent oxidoreductase [Pirellulaceae bacterium]